jgi:type II secretory pathway pseudopilin PulG
MPQNNWITRMTFKRIMTSRIFAIIAIVLAASATAYRYVDRQQRVREQQNKQRIEADVKNAIENLHLENTIKPLSEAGAER